MKHFLKKEKQYKYPYGGSLIVQPVLFLSILALFYNFTESEVYEAK